MPPEHPIILLKTHLLNMAAVAVKIFVTNVRQNAANWMLVIFFWNVIDHQSKEYRETGHREKLFKKTTQIKRLRGIYHIGAASGKNTTISLDISFVTFVQQIISWWHIIKIQSATFPVFLFFNINLRVEGEQIGPIVMHLHKEQRLRKIKDEPLVLTLGCTSGGRCQPPA